MHILVSNDDGYFTSGIRALADALTSIAEVSVVAPESNRSANSSAMTLYNPLRKFTDERGFIYMNGTPADCVHAGITGVLDTKPDMVVTGINNGANLGGDVIYSGTVGAAMEGRHLKYGAIAMSICSQQPKHNETAAAIAVQLVERVVANPLPAKTILNVNVPDVPLDDIKGIKITRCGLRHEADPIVKDIDSRGKDIYWVGAPGAVFDGEEGTDFHAVSENYVSVTPILTDLTHYAVMDDLNRWLG